MLPTSFVSDTLRLDPFLECFARGDSAPRCGESRSGLDWALWGRSDRRRPVVAFPGVFGERGVKELEEDDDDAGRGAVAFDEAAVLTVLFGRAGPLPLGDDGGGLAFTGGLAALMTLVRLALKAAL